MKINHIAVWVQDLEIMRAFFMKYFNMNSTEKYTNPAKQYTSYTLSFDDMSACIELMHKPSVEAFEGTRGMQTGLAHIAVSVGSKEKADELSEVLRKDKYIIAGEPRITGTGSYECIVLDPEGNRIEITV
jgi:lactoylglutathione lyase